MVGGLVPLQDQHMLSMLPSLLLMRMTAQRLLQSACAASFPAWCDRHLRQSALSWPLQRYHPSMVYLHPQDSFDMGTSPAATPAEPHYETTFSPYDRGSGQLHFPAQPHTMAADCIMYPGSLSVSQLVSCPGIVAPIKGDGLAHFKAFQLEDRRWTDACLVLAIVQGASLSVAAMALQCCKCMDYATDINKQAICSFVPELCLLLPYP